MSEEKRFLVFIVASVAIMLVMTRLTAWLWPAPPPRPPQAAAAKNADDTAKPDDADPDAKAAEPKARPADAVVQALPALPPQTRTIGSVDPASGFKLQVTLTNHGAAVEQVQLAEFKSEDRRGPLALVSTPNGHDASFLLGIRGAANLLETTNWEIAADVELGDADAAVKFRATVPDQSLVVTKTFRLKKGSYRVEMEIEIQNAGAEARSVAYRLSGPRGSVLEGAWYSSKLRDAVLAGGNNGEISRQTITAANLVSGAKDQLAGFHKLEEADGQISLKSWPSDLDPEVFQLADVDGNGKLSRPEFEAAAARTAGEKKYRWFNSPLRFAGVEGQFFCALVILPKDVTERWDAETAPEVILDKGDLELLLGKRKTLAPPEQSDVSFSIESRSVDIAPDKPLKHSFTIYAGPRSRAVLEAELTDPKLVQAVLFERNWFFIVPRWLVEFTSGLMIWILKLFQSVVGNWGVAILLLTALVRLCMFPISRKQAMSAAKMQALKPELDALRKKHGDDKQKMGQAQMELWRKHGVNPMGGCVPVLLQMPIFIGLWQGISNTVELRQAKFFFWIDNLAAPDALFKFPWPPDIFLLGYLGPFFNLLPAILMILMYVQQKLFMPPPADPPDPQMESQQKMMSFMMIFFGFIFWRLPSGLCLYYLASTSWGIAERKLMPKLQSAGLLGGGSTTDDKKDESDDSRGRSGNRPKRDPKPGGSNGKARDRDEPGWKEQLRELLDKARKK